jgi:dTDP-4-amino-4,6-dideoxygalactose transaminase
MLEKRKDYIGKYDAVCDRLGIFHLKHSGVDYQSSGHLYITRIPGIGEQERNEIITKLAERGVGANVHYKPLPMMTAYKAYGWDIKDFPNAYDYYHNLITLPLYTKMTYEDVDYVIEVFSQVVKEYI